MLLKVEKHSKQPLSTFWCPTDSCRNDRIPPDSTGMGLESTGMGLESTGIHRNGTGIHRNPLEWDRNNYIPAGMGWSPLEWDWNLQEWNRNIHVEGVAGAAIVVVAVHSYSNIQVPLESNHIWFVQTKFGLLRLPDQVTQTKFGSLRLDQFVRTKFGSFRLSD